MTDPKEICLFYTHIVFHTTTTLSVPIIARIVNVYTSPAADTRWLTLSPSLKTRSSGHFYDPPISPPHQPSHRILYYYYVPVWWVYRVYNVRVYSSYLRYVWCSARDEAIRSSAARWAGDETCRQENPKNSRLTIKYVIARDVVIEPRYLCVYFYCSFMI